MAPRNIPTVFVIFGATGDLMTKKITPALFHLFKKGKTPKMFRIIGVARRGLSDEEFRSNIVEILKAHRDFKQNDTNIPVFLKLFSYHQGQFKDKDTYDNLAKTLGRIDNEWKVCSNKLFYLAVPPEYYEGMFQHLASSGLTIPCGPEEGWTRVLVEKPFGKDSQTAERLDLLLARLFKEEQIYRIDHYLAKEMLQNILNFRFSNNLLEQSWNNKFIEKIEIRALETLGVEGRGPFYDGLGALIDFGQNHLLQMLALVTMEHPQNLAAEAVRRNRGKLLQSLRKLTAEEVKRYTFRGQYQRYLKINGVKPKSKTETYFKVKTFLDSPRWQGVPITLESGKKLKDPIKEVVIHFKHASPCLCPPGRHFNNKIVFSLEPEESIKIYFLSKKPGLSLEVEKQSLDFLYRKKSESGQYIEEYEKLLLDCIEGNQLLFLDTDEVRATWKFIDSIIAAWKADKVPLHIYRANANGVVEEAEKLINEPKEKLANEIGVVGLGKMGTGIARQLLEKGWKVIGYNRTYEVARQMENEGLVGAATLAELVKKLKSPRVIWIMVPPGKPVDEVIGGLLPNLQKGDIVIDAGNTFYKDDIKRSRQLEQRGYKFVDVGVSGGPTGARYGACFMVGGERKSFDYLLPLYIDLTVPQGVEFFAGVGAGHFVKMVHNGIEYGMMQAIAEGFTIMKYSKYNLDLAKVAEVYNHGSVIESKLMGWLEKGLKLFGEDLNVVAGSVPRGGEADWTVDTAKELRVKTKIIEEAVKFRLESEKNPSYTGKILNAVRNMFGGHSLTGQLWDRNYTKGGEKK